MRRAVLALSLALLAGCATAPQQITRPGHDHVGELLAHPQARAAAAAAPDFTAAALNRVAELSHDLRLANSAKP